MAFDNLHLEKGMYRQTGKTFSQVLETLDPSENYRGTSLEGSDAFQRQLKRFGIRLSGPNSDPVEKFFATIDSAVLFPEYVARTVRSGANERDDLNKLLAAHTIIDGMDYRSVFVDGNGSMDPAPLMEGTQIPVTQIQSRDHLIHLTKQGRMLVASYEAIRFQKLDVFSVTLRQIGSYIRKSLLNDAVSTLTFGDGNSNAATQYAIGTSPISGTSGTLSYAALCDFWAQFDPFEMNTLVMPGATMTKILQLSEFQNPLSGFHFVDSGRLVTPMGAEIVLCDSMTADTMLGLDARYALEMVQAGEISVEYDKLIDRQLERAAITVTAGFSKLYDDASAMLVI